MSPLRLGLIVLFAAAGLVCFAAIRGVARVPNPDTRRGLSGLLALSGLWAAIEVGRLVAPDPGLKIAFYTGGLVVGLATVGAWLYFCSVYTGHDYHLRPGLRRLAAVVYLGIVTVKLTNPYHGLYFAATPVSDPFRHVAIELMPAHWVVTGLAYALTAIGFYLLYELFSQSRLDTRALAALVLVTGLPAFLDVLSYTGSLLLTLNYEPVGVAVFAVGVLYVVDEQFVALPAFWREEILESLSDPVIVFDRFQRVRDYNSAAAEHFPELDETLDRPLDVAYPAIADALDADEPLIEATVGEETRYYVVETRTLAIESRSFGEVVVLSDVTTLEQQRRELERQNDQFDQFAEAITHELRNTLAIAHGYLEAIGDEVLDEDDSESARFYDRIDRAMTRMDRVTTDLSKLARHGQTLEDLDECDLDEIVTRSWERAETGEMSLSVESDGSISADRVRLTDLFTNAFEFAGATGASTVTVRLDGTSIVIESDGSELSADELDRAFAYGEAVPTAETGLLLPSVRTLARVHGWEATADGTSRDGLRLRVDMA
jgi:signal transduction histidine kinase